MYSRRLPSEPNAPAEYAIRQAVKPSKHRPRKCANSHGDFRKGTQEPAPI